MNRNIDIAHEIRKLIRKSVNDIAHRTGNCCGEKILRDDHEQNATTTPNTVKDGSDSMVSSSIRDELLFDFLSQAKPVYLREQTVGLERCHHGSYNNQQPPRPRRANAMGLKTENLKVNQTPTLKTPPSPLTKSKTAELDIPSDENNDGKDMEVDNRDPDFLSLFT
ncbi:hypothetical protein EVAR_18032_1 [Eumeta japonica]|uniref:Uncharacterized protein n=1 Tax=Eumeta variegata TaxID=151549 RepID=A0A4C1XSJ2_EUMVA|nr:hypothetical protein EVAR_18032_1 [Eumeta japonica]